MPSTEPNDSFEYFEFPFFSAFTTLPANQGNEEFLKKITEHFEGYKDGLKSTQRVANGDESVLLDPTVPYLYNPVSYCLFGEFDIAIFALIDDFSFATQYFKPRPESSFKYQINTGIIPLIEAYGASGQMPKFRSRTLPKFFSDKAELYPFTGIASVKINNSMMVGTGQDFLFLINYFLITFLDNKVKELDKKGIKLIFILNENLGWNESTIYFFGNSMSVMQDLLMDFRQVRLRDIRDHVLQLLHDPNFEKGMIHKKVLPIFDKIERESLLADLITERSNPKNSYLESHPVIATSISYGFRYELVDLFGDKNAIKKRCNFTEAKYQAFINECDRKGAIATGWKIKPGHERAANKLIKRCFPGSPGNVFDVTQTGKYAFTYPQQPISFADYLHFAKESIKVPSDEKFHHVIKLRSHLYWRLGTKFKHFNQQKHYTHLTSDHRITPKQIQEIQQRLCIYPIPYTFKNQIENLIVNYNEAISDPLMINYFIGLKFSLFSFLRDKFHLNFFPDEQAVDAPRIPINLTQREQQDRAKHLDTETVPEPDPENEIMSLDTESISEFIQNWNKAYWNRYFHSYYFTEINDFNIEHHGGIQQILFTYDTVYRLICKRIYGKQSKVPFVNVQVGPMITSTQFYNTINFNHLFRPAIYACECVHEAANHIIPYLVEHCKAAEYSFLFNPLKGRMDFDDEKMQDELECRLKEKVGPRDDYETRYLNEHFGLNAIRHLVTDFATYVLGYANPDYSIKRNAWSQSNFSNIKVFYDTHWFLFLIRTDLYYRESTGKGSWFFKESDFRALFMRFNLMFYLFMDFGKEQLTEINKHSPSIELKALWDSEKNRLLDLVYRLGDALKAEFAEQLSKYPDVPRVKNQSAIHRFRAAIVQNIFKKGWSELNGPGKVPLNGELVMMSERDAYVKVINENRKLIRYFHHIFSEQTHKNNIVIRQSNLEQAENGSNVRFYPGPGKRKIFLDPKGHLFSTSPKARKQIFRKNVQYIKNMWNLSLQICRKDYHEPTPKN